MVTKRSAADFETKRPNHLPTEGMRWPSKGQQQILQQRDQITYILRAEIATHGSAACFVVMRPDHLQAEGRDGHQWLSSMFCSNETRSLTS
jgi:hypothetical protein